MIRLTPFCLAFLCLLGFSGVVIAQLPAKPDQEKTTSRVTMQAKTVKSFFANLKGSWNGSYSLWLRPGVPAEESDIEANIQPAAKENYFLMTYSWKRGNDAHEGVFLFGGDGEAATFTWGDSFHSVPEPMHCSGDLKNGGQKLVFKGSYAAGSGPDWGWRTEFTRQGPDSFLMEAYNITPDGAEALAVKAELRRMYVEEE